MSIEWDGKGLPPVGCECEREGPGRWVKCKINYVSETLIVYKMTDSGTEYSSLVNAFMFRPIRTEAERRRDYAVGALERAWEEVTNRPAAQFEVIYDAIAAGKIPGIRLTDESSH